MNSSIKGTILNCFGQCTKEKNRAAVHRPYKIAHSHALRLDSVRDDWSGNIVKNHVVDLFHIFSGSGRLDIYIGLNEHSLWN